MTDPTRTQTAMLRATTPRDIPAIDTLLQRSYRGLLGADYPASVLVTALPRIVRAQPALIASGTYFAIFDGDRALAAGGWTAAAPGKGGTRRGVGHIRHVATDPAHLRQGLGQRLMDHIFGSAALHGITTLDCLSTRTAAPFYAACGFAPTGLEVEVPLGPGIGFPAIPMTLRLRGGPG